MLGIELHRLRHNRLGSGTFGFFHWLSSPFSFFYWLQFVFDPLELGEVLRPQSSFAWQYQVERLRGAVDCQEPQFAWSTPVRLASVALASQSWGPSCYRGHPCLFQRSLGDLKWHGLQWPAGP